MNFALRKRHMKLVTRKKREKKKKTKGQTGLRDKKVQKGKEQNETKTEIEFGTHRHAELAQIPPYL